MTETPASRSQPFQFRLTDLFAVMTACAAALALARYRSYLGMCGLSLVCALAVIYRGVPYRHLLATMLVGVALVAFGQAINSWQSASNRSWDPVQDLWSAMTLGYLLRLAGGLIVLSGAVLICQTALIRLAMRNRVDGRP